MSVARDIEAERGADPRREFELTDADFLRVADRIDTMAGIVLHKHKSQMIQARLSRRVRALNLGSVTEYLDVLDRPDGREELQEFVNTLTTNLTSLFREDHHFDHLRENVLSVPQESYRIWSAGCSSGEEAYSIAMAACAHLGQQGAADRVKILATDLDSAVLDRARAGRYPPEKCAKVPAPYDKFLVQVPSERTLTVAEPARRLIAFRQLNLMEEWPMRRSFDAIFCRNVVIYFSAETKAALLERFARLLRPGGYLYLGHSEAILGDHPSYVSQGKTVYQRREGAAP